MSEPVVRLKPSGAKRVRGGHLWVYRTDLEGIPELQGGQVVRVQDQGGNFLAKAFYSSASLIALRILTRQDQPIDDAFWRQRLERALQYRKLIYPEATTFRLVHSEGDLLPSIIIDKYDRYLALQTLSQGAEAVKMKLVDILVSMFSPSGIIERNDVKARELEGLHKSVSTLYGQIPPFVEVQEDGLRLAVDLISGQKTGLFLDQRENRIAAARYARGRALDCFSYSGAFALHLARRAEEVVAVESSPEAIALGRRNAELNGIDNVQFVEANCFDLLREYEQRGLRFDLIVLDPPAFAKSRQAIPSAIRGYKEINLRAMRLLSPGGVLVTCSCSYHVSERRFWRVLQDAAQDSKRAVQIIQKRTQAQDHPILLTVPESYYLKCFILRVL